MDIFTDNLVVVIVGAFALIVGFAFYLDWRRRNALADLAASMGLQFSKDGPEQYLLESTGLELFRLGRSRKATSMMETQVSGGRVQVFDYKYVTGSGKHSQTHNLTVALIYTSLQVPHFDLKPENFLYKIGELIGFKDIDLPAFPLFSDKYRLTAPEETAVHMFFTPTRAAWFESNLGLWVQGAPGHVLLFKGETRLGVDAWQGFLEEAKAFTQQVLR